MKSISLKIKQHLFDGSHVLATIAWTLVFTTALSTIFSGQTSSRYNTWNYNRTTPTNTSTIPLPKDWFTGSFIVAVALTAALFSSWVIPECALAMTEEVLALSRRKRPIDTVVELVDGDRETNQPQPTPPEPDKQIDDETKMIKMLINMMFHLENRLLRESIATEQGGIKKDIQRLEEWQAQVIEVIQKETQNLRERNSHLSAELVKATNLPREILNDTLQGENWLYFSNNDPAIAEQIPELQRKRDASLNGKGSLPE